MVDTAPAVVAALPDANGGAVPLFTDKAGAPLLAAPPAPSEPQGGLDGMAVDNAAQNSGAGVGPCPARLRHHVWHDRAAALAAAETVVARVQTCMLTGARTQRVTFHKLCAAGGAAEAGAAPVGAVAGGAGAAPPAVSPELEAFQRQFAAVQANAGDFTAWCSAIGAAEKLVRGQSGPVPHLQCTGPCSLLAQGS